MYVHVGMHMCVFLCIIYSSAKEGEKKEKETKCVCGVRVMIYCNRQPVLLSRVVINVVYALISRCPAEAR